MKLKIFFEKFKRPLLEILIYSQSHGIPKIVSSKRIVFKLMWSFCVIISFIFCIKTISETVFNYFQYPIVTKFYMIDSNPIIFPTITFCLINPTKRKYNLNEFVLSCVFNQLINCSNDFYIVPYENIRIKNCFQFNGKNKRLNTSRSGRNNGLIIKFFIGFFNETRDNVFNRIDRNGLEVIVHDSNDFLSRSNTIEVKPGTATSLSITKLVSSRQTLPYNYCIKDEVSFQNFNSTVYKRFLLSNVTYSQSECLDIMFYIDSNCIFTNDSDFIKCGQTDLNQYNDYYGNQKFKKHLSVCPLECDKVEYEVKTSFSDYPSLDEYLFLKQNNLLFVNNSISYFDLQKSVISIYAFYDHLKYTVISEEAKMLIWDLISTLGGTLSLFLGVSFLSFIELIQIFLEFIFILNEC